MASAETRRQRLFRKAREAAARPWYRLLHEATGPEVAAVFDLAKRVLDQEQAWSNPTAVAAAAAALATNPAQALDGTWNSILALANGPARGHLETGRVDVATAAVDWDTAWRISAAIKAFAERLLGLQPVFEREAAAEAQAGDMVPPLFAAIVLATVSVRRFHLGSDGIQLFWSTPGVGTAHADAARSWWARNPLRVEPVPPTQQQQQQPPQLPPPPPPPQIVYVEVPRPMDTGQPCACGRTGAHDDCGDADAQCARRELRKRIDELIVQLEAEKARAVDTEKRVGAKTVVEAKGEQPVGVPDELVTQDTVGSIRAMHKSRIDALEELIRATEAEWAHTFRPQAGSKRKEEAPKVPKTVDFVLERSYWKTVGLARAATYIQAYAERAVEMAAASIGEVGRAYGLEFYASDVSRSEFSFIIRGLLWLSVARTRSLMPAVVADANRRIQTILAQLQPNALVPAPSLLPDDFRAVLELAVTSKMALPGPRVPWNQTDSANFLNDHPNVNWANINQEAAAIEQQAGTSEHEWREAYYKAWSRILDSAGPFTLAQGGINFMAIAVARIDAALQSVHLVHEKQDIEQFARSMVTSSKTVDVLREYMPIRSKTALAALQRPSVSELAKRQIQELIRLVNTTVDAATAPVTEKNLGQLFLRTAPFQHVPNIDVVNTVFAAVSACIAVANNTSVHADEYRRALDASKTWVEELKTASERFAAKAVDAPLSVGLLNLLADAMNAVQDQAENVRTASDALLKLVPEADTKEAYVLATAWDEYKKITRDVTQRIGQLMPAATGARFKNDPIGPETSLGRYQARVETAAVQADAIIRARSATLSKTSDSLAREVESSLRALAKNYEFEITSDDRRRMAAQSEAIRGGRALVRVLADLVGSLLNKKPVIEAAFSGDDQGADYKEPLNPNDESLLRIIGTADRAARAGMSYVITKGGDELKDLAGLDRAMELEAKAVLQAGAVGGLAREFAKRRIRPLPYMRVLLRRWDRFSTVAMHALDIGLGAHVEAQSVVRGSVVAYVLSDSDARNSLNPYMNVGADDLTGDGGNSLVTYSPELTADQTQTARELVKAHRSLWSHLGVSYAASPTEQGTGDSMANSYALRRSYDLAIMRKVFAGDPGPKSGPPDVYGPLRVGAFGPIQKDPLTRTGREAIASAVRQAVGRFLPLANRLAGSEDLSVSTVLNGIDVAASDLRRALADETKAGADRSRRLLEGTATYCASKLREAQARLVIAAPDFNAPDSLGYHLHQVAYGMDVSFASAIGGFSDSDTSAVSKILRAAFEREIVKYLVQDRPLSIAKAALSKARVAKAVGVETDANTTMEALVKELNNETVERAKAEKELKEMSADLKRATLAIKRLEARGGSGGAPVNPTTNLHDSGGGDKSDTWLMRIAEFIYAATAVIGDENLSVINSNLFVVIDGQLTLRVKDPAFAAAAAAAAAKEIADPDTEGLIEQERLERVKVYTLAEKQLGDISGNGRGLSAARLWSALRTIAVARFVGATQGTLEYLASAGRVIASQGHLDNIPVKNPRAFVSDKRRTAHAEIFKCALSNEASRVCLGQLVGNQMRADAVHRARSARELRQIDDPARLARVGQQYARTMLEWYTNEAFWQ